MGTTYLKHLSSHCIYVYLKISVLVLGVVICISCGPDAALHASYFPLTIVVSGSLGRANSGLPEDIKAMCMPVAPKDCPSFLLTPDEVEIVRIDLPDTKPEPLGLNKLQNGVQAGFGQPLTLKSANSVRKDDLDKKQITSVMAQPSGPANIVNENLARFFAANPNRRIFTLASSSQAVGNAGGNDVVTANSIDELLTALGTTFCSKAGEEPKSASSVIVYKVGGGVAKSPTPGPNPTGTPTEEVDKTLGQIFRKIYADGVKTAEEQRELEDLLRKYHLTADQVAQQEEEIKDRMNRSEMSLKQGMMYVSQRRYNQAVKEFQHSTGIDSKNAYGWANLCQTYLTTGDQSNAKIACDKALEVDSNNWFAHYALGLFYAKSGNKAEAVHSLQEALRFVANDQNHRTNRAEVLRLMRADPMLSSLRNDPQFKQLSANN